MLLTSLIFFCGLMLATRFSVVVLVPAIPGALALAVIVGIWSSASASLLLLMMGLAVTAGVRTRLLPQGSRNLQGVDF